MHYSLSLSFFLSPPVVLLLLANDAVTSSNIDRSNSNLKGEGKNLRNYRGIQYVRESI